MSPERAVRLEHCLHVGALMPLEVNLSYYLWDAPLLELKGKFKSARQVFFDTDL